MKKILFFLLITTSSFGQFNEFSSDKKEPFHQKIFFANSPMDKNYFYSEVTFQAPSSVRHDNNRLIVSDKNFTPGNSLELEYTSAPNGKWQAKILYHALRGIDFIKPSKHLVFRMYLDSDTETYDLPGIAISDKDKTPSAFLPLGRYITGLKRGEWKKIVIPLEDFKSGLNVESLNVILFSQASVTTESKTHRIFIDQVELLSDKINNPDPLKAPRLISAEGYEKHVDLEFKVLLNNNVKYLKIYRSTDNKNFIAVGITSGYRYTDFTGESNRKFYYKVSVLDNEYNESPFSEVMSAQTKTLTDDQWLDMVQRAQFRYYWEGAEAASGLSLENIPGRKNMVALGAAGFGMMALIVGTERKFISHEEAVNRFDGITKFLEKTEKFHGAFSHFVDGPTGKVEPFFGDRDNGGDLVETSFLVQGLLTAQQYFSGDNEKEKAIRDRIQRIWEGIEWNWYRRGDSKFITWHWSPDKEWIIDHNLIGWNETMVTYLMAIASPTHSVPASMYYSGWASQSPEAQQYRANWGQTKDGDHYTNGNSYYGIPLKVGVSNGGPLFFVHYSYLGPNPKNIKDAYTDYFTNNKNIALINYKYCVDNPEKHKGYGPACWGLTASDGPWNYSANEPTLHGDEGKITPTGALASFPYMPEESMAALKNYYNNYGRYLWGEYGFRDAINLDENWCSEIYMGLNQAPVVVMIENYRTGLIWNLFSKNKDFQRALDQVAKEKP